MGTAIDGECKVCNLNNTQMQLAKPFGGVRGMVGGVPKAEIHMASSQTIKLSELEPTWHTEHAMKCDMYNGV